MDSEQSDHGSMVDVPTKQWPVWPYQLTMTQVLEVTWNDFSWLHRICGTARSQSPVKFWPIILDGKCPPQLSCWGGCPATVTPTHCTTRMTRSLWGLHVVQSTTYPPEIMGLKHWQTCERVSRRLRGWGTDCFSESTLLQKLNDLHITVIL